MVVMELTFGGEGPFGNGYFIGFVNKYILKNITLYSGLRTIFKLNFSGVL